MSDKSQQAPDETSPKSLYPTLDSLQQVEQLAETSLPIHSKNDLLAVLGTYHNTLLKKLGIKK